MAQDDDEDQEVARVGPLRLLDLPRRPQREIGHRICGDRHDRWVCNREQGHDGVHAATIGPQWPQR